jgi:hypothetical protein
MMGSLKALRRKKDRAPRSSRSRSIQPRLEGLEDRMLLYATEGAMWQFSSRVTYSFVPDGASIGGVSSNLFATLNSVAPTATWQAQFEKAAATWETYANINLAQVSDNGEALGAVGAQQGDPNVGDIRISMIPMGTNGTLAFAMLPPTVNGGTAAGDIVFNSSYPWSINGSGYDMETVAIHEMGHALGLAHSTDTTAVMYPYYSSTDWNPSADDQAGIASIYGAAPAPWGGNKTYKTPTNLTPLIANNQLADPGQYLGSATDTGWWNVTAPATNQGIMTVTMQSTNLSSVAPKLLVYKWTGSGVPGALVGQAASTNLGETVSVTVTGVTAGQQYIFRTSADASPGFVGSYGILVNFSFNTQNPIAPPNTYVASAPDRGGLSASDSTGGGSPGDPGGKGSHGNSNGNVDGNSSITDWVKLLGKEAHAADLGTQNGVDIPLFVPIGNASLAVDFLTTPTSGLHHLKPARFFHVDTAAEKRHVHTIELLASSHGGKSHIHDAALAHLGGDGHSVTGGTAPTLSSRHYHWRR